MNDEEKLKGTFNHHDFVADTKGIVTKIEEPVDFEVQGMLNVELISYMAELNAEITALLNGCTTYAQLEQMVKDLGVLLNTEQEYRSLFKALPNCQKENPALYKYIKGEIEAMKKSDKDNEAEGRYLKEIFYQISHVTNYSTMDKVADSILTATEVGEKIRQVYFYSPYGIYYLWMEAYGYLPSGTQAAQ